MQPDFVGNIFWSVLKTFWPWLIVLAVFYIIAELAPDFLDYLKRKNKLKNGTVSENSTDKICSACGSPMQIRSGKFGEFYGCTSYPKCKHTEKI
ncbi:MAG: topoisomerase DNA-binding C4 zinc finger domain-containing protein [Candidatus Doudnabacteria bacterium]|nr:topoisomerase DNA-binding C4 zinc finger domain-containing protein [Candidatus Doudnabacteria bacterium]